MSSFYLKRGFYALLPAIVAVFLAACSTLPGSPMEPAKSPNDDYQYRYLTLENGMPVLLVSDPDTKKAAASLDVLVGSADNPHDREGLAHFLEHMLFLGTDKYPDAAEYEQYTTEHGGSRNAYTSFEHTNYFFDINEAHLPEALDRFAQFFISPRFDAQYVDREKNAVEAEYQMGLKSDGRRTMDVLREVVNPEHPFSKFTVGSLETLADRPGALVRDDLIAFYGKHYSANQMRLVVMGAESLDELETLVVPMFSAVPNTDFQPEEISAPIFTQEQLPLLVKVKPQATLRQLQISFPIADYAQDYPSQPLAYLGNLVGHEGEGSLLSQLKTEALAEGLSAGAGLTWRGGGMFSINLSLTEKGVSEYERVLQLVFAYMEMLREEGPQKWLFDEQSQLAELRFRFRGDPEPIRYVSATSAGMHTYAPEDTLRGPYLMTRYDAPMLGELLAGLVPENVVVTLIDKSVETDRASEYYQVPYSTQLVDEQRLARWQAEGQIDQLHLPQPNEFIAEDVSLKRVVKDNPAIPAVVLEEGRQKIWFRQDDEFSRPRGASYVNFRSPMVGRNAQQAASAALYTALLKDSVNEFAYPAALAGLHFDFYKHAQGISLRISGYNDKQPILLDRILEAIESSSFDDQRFQDIRLNIIRSLQNVVAARPSSQVMGDMREALLYGEWGEQALIAELEKLDPSGLAAYADKFWASAQAEIMIYGNYDPGVVAEVSQLVSRVLSDGRAPAIPPLEILKLAPGESLQYAVDVPHDDSVVAWYLQGAGDSWNDRAATALTAQIMKSGFFQQLRTEQQLGYIAQAVSWQQLGVPALVMLIQSPTASASHVATAMDTFVHGVEGDISEEQFARHKQALLNDILRPDKNLSERAEFYWQSISRKQFEFDGRQAMASAVEALTLESWLAYFNEVFVSQRHSLQVVAPGRWEELPSGAMKLHRDADAIKQGHDVYVIP